MTDSVHTVFRISTNVVLVAAIASVVGCTERNTDVVPGDDSAQNAENRTRIALEGDEPVLLWERLTPSGWQRFWRSRDLYQAEPNAVLEDFNGDGTTDLYWSLRFDEIAGGAFVLNVGGRPVEVPLMIPQCEEPVLDFSSGTWRVIAFSPGVYDYDQCTGMDVYTECSDDVTASWPRAFTVVGTELVEDPLSAAAYQELAADYGRAAARLDSLYTAGALISGSTQTFEVDCGAELPQKFRVLADSADKLARASQ